MTPSLPDALTRRNILYGPNSPQAELVALGERYLAADRLLDALEFFARGGHAPGIDAIRQRAVLEGDAFLADRIALLGLTPLTPDEWFGLAETAEQRGLELFARRGFTRAGQADRAAAVGRPATAG